MYTIYLVLFVTVLLSGSLIFVMKTENRGNLKLLLAYSGAFLIGISFMKLVPEVFESGVPFAGLFVMVGFLIQLVLELITEGVEHGHSHVHHEGERVSPFILLTGLSIHGFLEGTPISTHMDTRLVHSLTLGIVIHNIPISLTLMSLLLHYGCSKTKSFLYLSIFAFMTPLGSLLSGFIRFESQETMEHFFTYVMAVVIGIFLHVSTSILFEAESNHHYNLKKFATVVLGIATALGLCFI